jgi:hypothetical protein
MLVLSRNEGKRLVIDGNVALQKTVAIEASVAGAKLNHHSTSRR